MREMKDSGLKWIGAVPKHWEVRKVKNYYHMQTGFTPDTKNESYYDDVGGYDWVNISDIQDGKVITSSKKKVSQSFVDAFRPAIIPEGSLMYSFKLSVGQTAFAGKPMYSNEAIASFLPDESVNLHYLRYSSMFIVENAQTNIYNAKILNQDLIQNAYVPFPPLAEQRIIADYLDQRCAEIDAVIERTKATIEEYKKLKQSIITEAVTKGIRGDRPMKDSGIAWVPQIAADWHISRIGLHYDVILGKMLCDRQLQDDYTLEDYFCAANVHFDGVATQGLKKMWFSPAERENYHVNIGDLLVVEGGAGAGGAAIVTELINPTYIQNSIMIVRGKHSQTNRYLRYWIECLVKKGYVDVVCNKATIPHFTKDKLATMPIPVLDETEMLEIADYLDEKCLQLDALIARKTALLEEMESYKKSVIYEYVTGKKEV